MADQITVDLQQGSALLFQSERQRVVYILLRNLASAPGQFQQFQKHLPGLGNLRFTAHELQAAVPGNGRYAGRPLNFFQIYIKLSEYILLVFGRNIKNMFFQCHLCLFPFFF